MIKALRRVSGQAFRKKRSSKHTQSEGPDLYNVRAGVEELVDVKWNSDNVFTQFLPGVDYHARTSTWFSGLGTQEKPADGANFFVLPCSTSNYLLHVLAPGSTEEKPSYMTYHIGELCGKMSLEQGPRFRNLTALVKALAVGVPWGPKLQLPSSWSEPQLQRSVSGIDSASEPSSKNTSPSQSKTCTPAGSIKSNTKPLNSQNSSTKSRASAASDASITSDKVHRSPCNGLRKRALCRSKKRNQPPRAKSSTSLTGSGYILHRRRSSLFSDNIYSRRGSAFSVEGISRSPGSCFSGSMALSIDGENLMKLHAHALATEDCHLQRWYFDLDDNENAVAHLTPGDFAVIRTSAEQRAQQNHLADLIIMAEDYTLESTRILLHSRQDTVAVGLEYSTLLFPRYCKTNLQS